MRAGSILHCGAITRGARSYLAVGGGFEAPRVLGSLSTDINTGLGPFGGRALKARDVLKIGPPRTTGTARELSDSAHGAGAKPPWSLDPRPWSAPWPTQPVRLLRGTHFGALDADSRRRMFDSEFRIAGESNRVGLRLEGSPLRLSAPLELISEPVATGTVQLPPDGQPIVLMVEHPTTGGYPRIGQIAAVDLPILGQCRPGDALRFAPIELDEAQTRYLARERELALLIETIAERLVR